MPSGHPETKHGFTFWYAAKHKGNWILVDRLNIDDDSDTMSYAIRGDIYVSQPNDWLELDSPEWEDLTNCDSDKITTDEMAMLIQQVEEQGGKVRHQP